MSENWNAAMTMTPSVPERAGTENLQPLGVAGQSTQLWLAPPGQKLDKAPTSVSLSDQGLVQVLEASVTGLEPGKPYVLALSNEASGGGALQALQGFMLTLRPKLRKVPRRSFSIAIAFDCSSLRCVSSIRSF